MSSWTTAGSWLLHCGAGGGLLLLLTCFLVSRARQPAMKQRLGEWGLAAALVVALLSLVGPVWLTVQWPVADALRAEAPHSLPPFDLRFPVELVPPAAAEGNPALPEAPVPPPEPALLRAVEMPAVPWWRTLTAGLLPWVVGAYALGAFLVLGRWLLGHAVLLRLLRRAQPAPPEVARLFAAMAGGPRPPRLLVSLRVRVPISCGLLRPTVVLPAPMCTSPAPRRLRWVFAHELTHLERRDAWSALLFALGQAVYFLLPWFWWLRRQVRLCQEYVADAAAAGHEPAVDYAEFLLSLTGAPAVPAAATGVSGPTSDLFRRVRMLLQKPVRVEKRCPRRWSLTAAGVLFALAVVVAGVGLRAEAAPPLVLIVTQEQDAKPEGKRVRVLVLPAPGQEQKSGKVILIRKAVGVKGGADKQKVFKDVIVQKLVRPDGAVLSLRHAEPSLDALRKALEQLEKNPAQADVDALRKALEGLKPRAAAKKIVVGQDFGFKIDFEGLGKQGSPKHLQAALEALRKVVKDLEQQHNQVDPTAIGKQIQHDLKRLDLRQAPTDLGLKVSLRREGGQARLGVQVEKPSGALADQLDLSKGQGLLVTSVKADSPAAKAGLKVNDVLLELNGKPVSGEVGEFVKQVASLKGGAAVDAVVLRKGKKETVKGIHLAELSSADGWQMLKPQTPGGPLAGRQGDVMTTVFRTADRFTTRYQEGSLIITLTGSAADGKARVGEIHVQDGKVSNKYDNVERVPAQYRDKVNHLLEISARGQLRIEQSGR